MDKITKYLDECKYVVGLFLDFSKAFDTVDHSILLDKLFYYGIRSNVLSCIKSYLSDRSQYVYYNNVMSSTKHYVLGYHKDTFLEPSYF